VIRELFNEETPYRIIKRNPKIYHGRQEIIKYWKRNKDRQKELRIKFKITKNSGNLANVQFKTLFFDLSESQNQIISGNIKFKIKNNSIDSLKEAYTKEIF
jgi:hypothetical protein